MTALTNYAVSGSSQRTLLLAPCHNAIDVHLSQLWHLPGRDMVASHLVGTVSRVCRVRFAG